MSYIVKVIPAPAGTTSTEVVYIPALGRTVVDTNSTQTLTNKTFSTNTTITAPTVANATVTGGTITNAAITGGTITNATITNATVSNGTATGSTLVNCTINTPTTYVTVASLAATGGNIATANAIVSASGAFIRVTGADGSKGIQLPVAVAGARYIVKNSESAAAALKVYPQVNSQINEVGANTALSMAANTSCEFYAFNATFWYSVPKVPS
jgi:hypothetical protein